MMENNKSMVVLSGGQDSTTCLLKEIEVRGAENVRALIFNYGQRHKVEIEHALWIANELGVQADVVNVKELNDLAENALTRPNIAVKAGKNGDLPSTFVDGRNMLFLTYAAIFAKRLGIHDIVTGVCETDFSGYPDCRDTFIKSLNVTLNLAMDYQFRIHTPMMWLTKADEWEMADKMGKLEFVRDHTHTCYNGVEGGCGECPACKLRNRGLEEYLKRKEGK